MLNAALNPEKTSGQGATHEHDASRRVLPTPAAVWKNAEFDPALRPVYYVRMLEIPTPRWTAYDAKRFKMKLSKEVRKITQERAFTSPIWYSP